MGRSASQRPLPNYRESSGTFVPELTGPGIRLGAAPYSRPDGARALRLVGVFQCVEGDLKELEVPLLQAVAILLVDRASLIPYSFSPVGDALVFDDDIQRVGKFRRGFFEMDVFAHARVSPRPGVYDLSASLGPYLSPVVRVSFKSA